MTTDGEHTPSTADIAYGDQAREENGAEESSDTEINSSEEHSNTPLVAEQRAGDLGRQWTSIQARFVDAPREAVQEADALVAEVIQDLARTFADERAALEAQWDRGDDVDTEALSGLDPI
jgi:hypothetical protein